MNTQANTNTATTTTGNSSILDLMLQMADEKFGKTAGRSKSTSYISRAVSLLTDEKGQPKPAIKLNKLVATMALEKATAILGNEPNMQNPEHVDTVSTQLKKCFVGVKQVFGTADNANSIKFNPAYKNKYKGIVNADGTVMLELIEQTADKK